MRAVVVDRLGSIENGRLVTVPDPSPASGQVVVAVEATAVNFVDVVTMTGRYQFTPVLPYTPGKGPVGTIIAVGEGVESPALGDRVLAMAEYGGFADQVLVDAHACHPIPPAIASVDAAAMAVAYDTAWMALVDRADLRAGESVLVLGGTGAVGSATIELARALGAGRVLASASTMDRVPHRYTDVLEDIIDLSVGDPRESIRQQVRERIPEGVDVVIDTLGGDAFDGAIRSLAWRGRIVSVGYASGRIPTLAVNYLLLKNIAASGLQISDYRKRLPDLVRRAFGEIFDHAAARRIRTPETITFPLERWLEPLRLLEQRQADRRLVIEPN